MPLYILQWDWGAFRIGSGPTRGFSIEESPPGGEVKSFHPEVLFTDFTPPLGGDSTIE